MSRKIYILLILSFYSRISFAQLSITSGVTAQQLVNTIVGQGISVSNISFTGDTTMVGIFNSSGTNIGLNSGIILTSGNALNAIGPNISNNIAGIFYLPGDSILDSLANATTYDACILEFDFVPQSNSVSFRYVFGSDEYPEFVCSQFNDVFAFFISGPGITGSTNLALIPSTTTPVAINTVNSGVPGANASPGTPCGLGYSNLYVDNMGGTTIEYDGFTVPMTAQTNLQPCGLYHMKIMIADAGDANYDSGVFLESGSLFSNPAVNAGADQTICSGNSVQLGTSSTTGYNYNWNPLTGMTGSNTATPTVTLTNSTSSTIDYTFVVIGNSGTCLFTDTVVVSVLPAPSASFTTTPNPICSGDTVTVNYTGTQAAGYTWNFSGGTVLSGSGSGPYELTFFTPGTYTITVDAISPGCSSSDSSTVAVNAAPVSSFNLPPDACAGEDVTITFNGTAGPSAVFTWNFAGGQITSGTGIGPYQVNWTLMGLMNVTLIITENGCASLPATNQILIPQPPTVFAGNDTSVCPTSIVQLGEIAQPGSIYLWSPTDGLSDPAISNPTLVASNNSNTIINNLYTVTITSPQGCTASNDIQLTIIPGIDVDFASTGKYCLQNNSVDFNIVGNYPAGAVFSWHFGTGATPQTSITAVQAGVTYIATGLHTITLNASSGICTMQPVIHEVEIFESPVVDFSGINRSGCSPLLAELVNLSPDPTNSFHWQLSNGTSFNTIDGTANLIEPGEYDLTLTATSVNGCSTTVTKSKYLIVYPMPASDFSANPPKATIEAPVIYFSNHSTNATSYYWLLGDSTYSTQDNVTHTYPKKGFYDVTLIAMNTYGCIDTSYGRIEISEGFSFYIPNAFTPDGDGNNDFFQGYGTNLKSYTMMIFNRWGEKIYQTSEYSQPWNGMTNDRAVEGGVYVYKVVITDDTDAEHEYVGAVTVVR